MDPASTVELGGGRGNFKKQSLNFVALQMLTQPGKDQRSSAHVRKAQEEGDWFLCLYLRLQALFLLN